MLTNCGCLEYLKVLIKLRFKLVLILHYIKQKYACINKPFLSLLADLLDFLGNIFNCGSTQEVKNK